MIKSFPPVLVVPVLALSFVAGVLCLQLQSQLIALHWSGILIPACISCYYYKKLLWILFFMLGLFWANGYAINYLQAVPDQSLTGQNVRISGVIADLPVVQDLSIKFLFDIENFDLDGYSGPVPKHVRLSWYYANVELKPGDRWHFIARLKPPNGFQNPGGFDYEAWLYQQGIHATGYIRKSPLNRQIGKSGESSSINRLRYRMRQQINSNASAELSALLNALAIGYRGDMSAESWQVFINTGTNHLIAISGLHIGLVAGFVWLVLRLFSRVKILNPYLTQRSLLLISFLAALSYAALASFTIPTQRALIMLAVVYLGLFFYRQLSVLQSLSLALIVVLIVSPTSVLSVGFWLSFLAVAAISYSLTGRMPGRNKVMVWLWPQLVVIVMLIPLGFYFFQQTSVIALVANILAIPVIGMLILPILLAGMLVMAIYPALSSLLISLSADILSYLMVFLSYLSEYELSVWVHNEPGMFSLLLAMLGLVLLFSPYAIPARLLSVFFLLPLFLNKPAPLAQGIFELHVIDVGQGLSVFVKTRDHQLLFDTGARFSSRFDIGQRVVVPFLRQQGVSKLDKLIISNGDNDHIGGADSIIRGFDVDEILGRDIEKLSHANKRLCKQGQKWQWDGVDFEILHPKHQRYRKRNNYSCVLKISNQYGSALIAADIEKKAELELVKSQAEKLKSDLIIVPHHGSKGASSEAFLQHIKPTVAIYSSGYMNRYRFPRPEVIERYQQQASQQYNTAETGHLKILFDQNSMHSEPLSYRSLYRRYWHRTQNKQNIH